VDGQQRPCPPVVVRVRGRDAFAPQPAGLRYHVDACVVEPTAVVADLAAELAATESVADALACDASAGTATPSDPFAAFEAPEDTSAMLPSAVLPFALSPSDDAFTFGLPLGEERIDEAARLLDGAPGGGLVAHALALRVFFPQFETSGDPAVAAALDGVRGGLRDLFDRLFVKLRIPGFAVASDDLDDVALRGAMIGLFDLLRTARAGDDRGDGATVRIARARASELLAAFAHAPYGAPAVLRALVALMPVRCDGDPLLSAALARYACALGDAVARYDGVPLEIFDDALARASDRALDEARAALAVALRSRCAPFAELSC
jgi:hypothetical protein